MLTGLVMLEAKNSINPFIAAAFKVMLFTGARCGEVLTLKWAYINTALGIANLPDSKTGQNSKGFGELYAQLCCLPMLHFLFELGGAAWACHCRLTGCGSGAKSR